MVTGTAETAIVGANSYVLMLAPSLQTCLSATEQLSTKKSNATTVTIFNRFFFLNVFSN